MKFKRQGPLWLPEHARDGVRRYAPQDLDRYRERYKKRYTRPVCAITLGVGPATNTGVGLGSLAVTLNGTSSGRSLVLIARWLTLAVSITSVTCTSESNLTLIGSRQQEDLGSGGDYNLQLAYLSNITASGNKTITVSFSGTSAAISLWVQEFIGGDTSEFYDGAEAGADAATVNITTNSANAMVIGVIASNGGDPTAGTGYTDLNLGNTFWYENGQYKLDSGAAGSKTFDFGASGTSVIKCAAFKPAGGGGTTDGAGSAAGTGTATGIGASTAASAGAASGTGTASGTSTSTAAAAGSAAGTGTATGTASSTAESAGTATGTAAATGAGSSTAEAVGSASGAGTANGFSDGTVPGAGSASGTGTATGIGAGIHSAAGAASGTGDATAVGAPIGAGAGAAAGTGTGTGAGRSTAETVGIAAGVALVVGISGNQVLLRIDITEALVTEVTITEALVTSVEVSESLV